jgi:hypothetical protein
MGCIWPAGALESAKMYVRRASTAVVAARLVCPDPACQLASAPAGVWREHLASKLQVQQTLSHSLALNTCKLLVLLLKADIGLASDAIFVKGKSVQSVLVPMGARFMTLQLQ